MDRKNMSTLYKDNSISISIYYSVDELVDEETLRKEAEKNNILVKFEDNELKGIVSIKLNVIPEDNIDNILSYLRQQLTLPFEMALKKKDKKSQIIAALNKTDYLKNFIKLAQRITADIKSGIQDVGRLRKDIERHSGVLGETGINLLMKIFSDPDVSKIVDNYGKFQELIINKFAYELFIAQQLEHCFLLLLFVDKNFIRSNGITTVEVENLKDLRFKKTKWNIPIIGYIEVFIETNRPNIELFEKVMYAPKSRASYIFLRLIFLNGTAGLKFIDYSLQKESEILMKEDIAIPYNVEEMRNKMVSYGSYETKLLSERLKLMLDTSSSFMHEILLPIKLAIDDIRINQTQYDKRLIEDYMKIKHRDEKGLTIGTTLLNPPQSLRFQLPSVLIKEISKKIEKKEDFCFKYQEILRLLIQEAEDIRHQKELKEKEIRLYNAKLTTEKINRFTDQLPKLSSILRDWFKPNE